MQPEARGGVAGPVFFVQSAELLRNWHAHTPVVGLLTDSRALVAKDHRGHAVMLLPLDYVRWIAATENAVREVGARVRQELATTQWQIALTGRASARASRELAALGWALTKPATAPA